LSHEDEQSEDAKLMANEKLDMILASFNKLHDSFVLTVKDYYNVRSANYLSFNSNTQSNANVNLKLYLIVAVFMFFVLWTCFFVVADRMKDILKYINDSNEEDTTTSNKIQ
jgi:hypothetical protein